ncbi:hypothetical protein DFAR_2330025 [Desulfarculales bacterium]
MPDVLGADLGEVFGGFPSLTLGGEYSLAAGSAGPIPTWPRV